MKLTTKIVSLWMAGTLIVVAAVTFFAIRHDGRLLQDDLRSEASEIGQTLAPLIQDAWRTSGEQRALQLIADANHNNRQLKVRWVWLDENTAAEGTPVLSQSNLQAVRDGQLVYVEEREPRGRGVLHTYVPVAVAAPRSGAIELTNSLDGPDRIASAAILRFALLGAVLIVLSAAAASLL